MKILKQMQFGNPILRQTASRLNKEDIASPKIQKLIKNMQHTLNAVQLGIGLAAPQVGEKVSLAVISIRPTKHRPDVKPYDLVIINPEIVHTFGRRKQLWEGCISSGPGKNGLFAKVPRYQKIKLKYWDEKGVQHEKVFESLQAHVIQHEVNHLNGILFPDLVKDTKTYMTYSEYLKYAKKLLRK